ncbi:MAG: FHA domain-containing protein [Planctomycetota bacterium]|nr:MAG: FHA domain-containing protein [Planctomycetota bacterium]
MPSLEFRNGPLAGTVLELDEARDAWDVGGARRAAVRLVARTVSFRHALLRRHGEGYAIRDERSREGTFVNGRRLAAGETRVLAPGDRLRFGEVEATLRWEAPSPRRSASARLALLQEATQGLDAASLAEELRAAREEVAALRSSLAKRRRALESACAERDALREALDEATAGDVARAAEAAAARAAEAEAAAARAETERRRAAERLAVAENELRALRAAPADVDERLERERAARAAAEARARELQGQVDRLRSRLAQALAAPPEACADAAAAELEETRARLDAREEELAKLRAERGALLRELEERDLRIRELAAARQELIEDSRAWASPRRRGRETRPAPPDAAAHLRSLHDGDGSDSPD